MGEPQKVVNGVHIWTQLLLAVPENWVQQSFIGDILVSTVELPFSVHLPGFLPQQFETMIFDREEALYLSRCSTWDEALATHEAAIQKAKVINESRTHKRNPGFREDQIRK